MTCVKTPTWKNNCNIADGKVASLPANYGRSGIESIGVQNAREYFEDLFDKTGDKMPNLVPPEIHLPSCLTKLEVWRSVKRQLKSVGLECCSYARFVAIWKKHYKQVKIPQVIAYNARLSCTPCSPRLNLTYLFFICTHCSRRSRGIIVILFHTVLDLFYHFIHLFEWPYVVHVINSWHTLFVLHLQQNRLGKCDKCVYFKFCLHKLRNTSRLATRRKLLERQRAAHLATQS